MALRLRTSPSPDRPSVAMLLGVGGGHEEEGATPVRAHLEQVAAAWPMAAAVQAVAMLAACIVAGWAGDVVIPAMLAALSSAAVWSVTRLPLPGWRAHDRARALAAASAALAGSLLPVIANTAGGPESVGVVPAAVMLTGAAGLSGLAVHAVRAAILSFGAGLVAAMAVLFSAPLVLAEAAVLLGALALATIRLARFDRAAMQAETARRDQGRQAVKMIAEFEGTGTGWFWEADRSGCVTYLSARVAAELEAHDAAPVGRPLTDIFRMNAAAGAERTLAFHLSSRTAFTDYSVCAASDRDGARWWSISGRPVFDTLGRFQGFIGSGTDLTERHRSEEEIKRLALFDGLTGLANRQRMRLSLDTTLAQAAAHHRPASLFLMDLDRFKAVNDTLGHQAGDALLKQVAQRLLRVVGEAGLVGRMGGDEFQVLLPDLHARDALATLARAVIDALSRPYLIDGTQVGIGCSIGIAIAPHDGEDAETLVRNADLALYAAKGAGRGVHRFYTEELLEGARHRQRMEEDLRAALAAGDLHLCYQPVVATADQRIVGYEALVRWEHPARGPVSPAEFVPLAEECGLIEALGDWVLRTACFEAAGWPGDVRVSVNVSAMQFGPQLPALVASAIAHAGLSPERLELEISEGVFLHEAAGTDQIFGALKGLGVRLALDDFGTGYSALGYLQSAPFDTIKIGQSFVRGIAYPGNRNGAIIKAIVTLAETLGMETTAEGVEVQDEIDLVRALGCSHIQGYVFGRPGRSDAVADALGSGAGMAQPIGFPVTRAPRTRMLRTAHIVADGKRRDVRIRNLSATGAMIDGMRPEDQSVGLDLLIELVEDHMVAAQVRWAQDGRAGLRFAEAIDVAAIAAAPGRMRRAG